jgi:hypothetical protein
MQTLHKICNLYKREGHEVNDCPLKKLGGQYARKDILINVGQLEILVKQSKQEQNYQQLNNNPSYKNQKKEGHKTIKKEETKVGETIEGFNIIKMDNPKNGYN